jgi:hypothetical protein
MGGENEMKRGKKWINKIIAAAAVRNNTSSILITIPIHIRVPKEDRLICCAMLALLGWLGFTLIFYLAVIQSKHDDKAPQPEPAGSKGRPVSLHPLSTNDAVRAIVAIKPDDVKRIISATPAKGKRKK